MAEINIKFCAIIFPFQRWKFTSFRNRVRLNLYIYNLDSTTAGQPAETIRAIVGRGYYNMKPNPNPRMSSPPPYEKFEWTEQMIKLNFNYSWYTELDLAKPKSRAREDQTDQKGGWIAAKK